MLTLQQQLVQLMGGTLLALTETVGVDDSGADAARSHRVDTCRAAVRCKRSVTRVSF